MIYGSIFLTWWWSNRRNPAPSHGLHGRTGRPLLDWTRKGMKRDEKMRSLSGWWFGCHFLFSHILWMSSSQLTNSYCSEGWVSNHQAVMVFSGATDRFHPTRGKSTGPLKAGPDRFVTQLTLGMMDGHGSKPLGRRWPIFSIQKKRHIPGEDWGRIQLYPISSQHSLSQSYTVTTIFKHHVCQTLRRFCYHCGTIRVCSKKWCRYP